VLFLAASEAAVDPPLAVPAPPVDPRTLAIVLLLAASEAAVLVTFKAAPPSPI